ncbi:MAG: zinc ribbon domain-containing protein [Phycisphaerales bacterium]
MPTYDYRCSACKHEFELFQSMSESPKRKCPKCGKLALERLIGTGAAVLFKGGGFYETDYRSDSYKKAAEAEKKSESGGGESKNESKNDSKSGDKAKTKDTKKSATKPESKPDAGASKSAKK